MARIAVHPVVLFKSLSHLIRVNLPVQSCLLHPGATCRCGAGRDDCGSGLSRESSRDDINSECEQQFEYEQVAIVFLDLRELYLLVPAVPCGPAEARADDDELTGVRRGGGGVLRENRSRDRHLRHLAIQVGLLCVT